MAEVAVETKAVAIMTRWRRFLAIKEGEEEKEEGEYKEVAVEEVEKEEMVVRKSVDAALRVK